MSNPNKRKGSAWEIQLRDRLNELGLRAHRMATSGSNDLGDLAFTSKYTDDVYVIEAKATKSIDLPGFLAEATVEAANYAAAQHIPFAEVHPVVIVKRRMAPTDKAYVVMELAEWLKVIQ